MKSLVLFRYQQPVCGSKFRWGVLCETRDTKKEPLSIKTILGPYRKQDPEFHRTRNIDTVRTTDGIKAFYRERQKWKISIPFLGSLAERFIKV